MREGELIYVVRKDASGWWEGRRDGDDENRVGWFPSSYGEAKNIFRTFISQQPTLVAFEGCAFSVRVLAGVRAAAIVVNQRICVPRRHVHTHAVRRQSNVPDAVQIGRVFQIDLVRQCL